MKEQNLAIKKIKTESPEKEPEEVDQRSIRLAELGIFPKGATPTYVDDEGRTLFHLLCENVGRFSKTPEKIREICSWIDVDMINHLNKKSQTPILVAAEKGSLLLFKEYANLGACIRYPSNQWTCLTIAIANNHISIINEIVSDPRFKELLTMGPHGWFPLICAAQCGSVESMKILLNARIDVNQTGNEGWTPLMVAALAGNTAIAQVLLARGATVDATTTHGGTALGIAAHGGHIKFTKLLLTERHKYYTTTSSGKKDLESALSIVEKAREVAPPAKARGMEVCSELIDTERGTLPVRDILLKKFHAARELLEQKEQKAIGLRQ